jgi:hypothetical protein
MWSVYAYWYMNCLMEWHLFFPIFSKIGTSDRSPSERPFQKVDTCEQGSKYLLRCRFLHLVAHRMAPRRNPVRSKQTSRGNLFCYAATQTPKQKFEEASQILPVGVVSSGYQSGERPSISSSRLAQIGQ